MLNLRIALTTVLLAFLVGALATLAVTASIYLIERSSQASTLANLRRSYAIGALGKDDWLPKGDGRGSNQYNDCLLVQMVALGNDPLADTIAPPVIFNDSPLRIEAADGSLATECSIARSLLTSPSPRLVFPRQAILPYDRYVHGYRIPSGLLLKSLDVAQIRTMNLWTCYGLLAVLALLSLARINEARAIPGPAQPVPLTGSIFLFLAAIGFAAFYAVPSYGPSLTHSPSDMLLFLSLIGLLAWPSLLRSTRRLMGAAAMFGSLMFCFDFLHGALPIGLATLLGSTAMSTREEAKPEEITGNLVTSASGYMIGVGAALTIKLLCVLGLGGSAAIHSFADQLHLRTSGTDISLWDGAEALRLNLYRILPGGNLVGLAVVRFAAIAGAMALVRIASSSSAGQKARAAGLVASVLVIGCWYLVFKGHTAAHAGWMVRLVAWPLIASAGLILLVYPRTWGASASAGGPGPRPA